MPNRREGILGLGWHLNAGGAITRVVNGRPDEASGIIGGMDYFPHGHYYGVYQNYSVKTKSLQSIFDLSAGTVNIHWYWNVDDCEVDPDIFSFSMPGFSGRFYIQNNGEPKCIGSKPFKVDLCGFSIQSMSGLAENDVNDSEIIITTDDGYKYYFGGDISYLGVRYSLNTDDEVCDPVIVSWYVTKIVAPNGREVDFEYHSFTEGIYHIAGSGDETPWDTEHYLFNINHVRAINEDTYALNQGSPPSSYATSGSSGLETFYSVTQTAYLDNINIDDNNIHFYYAEKDQIFYTSAPYSFHNYNQKNLKLEKIEVQDSKSTIKKEIEFGQEYLGDTNPRMFLTSFGVKGINPYKFDYYGVTGTLPDPLTLGVDHWGFWNNYSWSEGSNVPTLTYKANGDVIITGNERAPNTAYFKEGMLEEIIYPTGGKTTFFYEHHEYSKRLSRIDAEDFLPALEDVTGNVGGARISKIIDNDGTQDAIVREFKYLKDYPAGGSTSSGILLDWPRYAFYWEYNNGSTTSQHLKIRSSSFNRNYSGNESFIQYSEVTEISYPDNGYINFVFTDFVSNQDENDFDTTVLDYTTSNSINNIHLWNNYIGIKFNDKSFERGIPKKVSIYQKQGSEFYLVKKTETIQFTGKSDFPNSYLVGVHQTGGIAQSFKIYYHPFLPKQTTETLYDENESNPVIVTTNHEYNNYGYLIKKDVTSSDGSTIEENRKYINDYNSSIDNFNTLNTNNILNRSIKNEAEIDGNKQIGGNIKLYTDDGQIREVYNYESETLKDAASHDPAVLIPPDYISKVVLNFDNTTKNLKTIVKQENLTTSYIWSLNDTYPVIKGENVDNSTLQTAVNSAVSTLSGSIQDLDELMDLLLGTMHGGWFNLRSTWKDFNEALRSDPSMSEAMITTYTFDPLIGMTSQTGPAGITTYYEYDDFGRLKEIDDSNEHLRELYNYNYHVEPELSADPDYLEYNEIGGGMTTNITSNIAWTVTDSESWISVSLLSGSDNADLTITVTPNGTTSSRPGTVTVSDDSGMGLPDLIISINQAGITPSITLSKYYSYLYGSNDYDDVGVTSNVPWTWSVQYYDDYGWLMVHTVAGSGYNGTLQFNTIDTPPIGETWYAEIEVTDGNSITRTISVYLSN